VKAAAIAIAGIALCGAFQFAPIQQSAVAAEPETQAIQPDPNEARILTVKTVACANERAFLMRAVEIRENPGARRFSDYTFERTRDVCKFLPEDSLVRIVQTDTVKVVASGPLVVTSECLRPIYPYVSYLTISGRLPTCFWTEAGLTRPFTEKLPDYITSRIRRGTIPSVCYGAKFNKAECEKQSWYEVQIPRRD
jgi:hypothetical protein